MTHLLCRFLFACRKWNRVDPALLHAANTRLDQLFLTSRVWKQSSQWGCQHWSNVCGYSQYDRCVQYLVLKEAAVLLTGGCGDCLNKMVESYSRLSKMAGGTSLPPKQDGGTSLPPKQDGGTSLPPKNKMAERHSRLNKMTERHSRLNKMAERHSHLKTRWRNVTPD